jgi:hypothetical protein
MSWQSCVVDDDYQIYDEYPYQIRRKSNKKIIKECIDSHGYVHCKLNNKIYYKHRIVALQFIPNPENKEQIDHIDQNKINNHISNLRWCSRSENNKNRGGQKCKKFVILDELPETAEPLTNYNNHELKGVFIDLVGEKLYLFNDVKYRELTPLIKKGNIYYQCYDKNNKQTCLSHSLLFE